MLGKAQVLKKFTMNKLCGFYRKTYTYTHKATYKIRNLYIHEIKYIFPALHHSQENLDLLYSFFSNKDGVSTSSIEPNPLN